jgi:hypothetical protein
MKNLLIGIVLLLAFTSCTKVIISEPVEKKAELTTFTITDNMKLYPPTEFVDGSLWEIIVYYYNKDVIIGFQEIDPILTGDKSKLINDLLKINEIGVGL